VFFLYNHTLIVYINLISKRNIMPIIKSAIKRAKQTIVRRERNVGIKRDIKEATKAFLAKPSAEALSKAHSELDTAVKKKLLKKNTVARRKASLAKVAKDAGVKLATAKKVAAPKAAAKPAAKPATKTAAKKPAASKAPVAKKPAAKKPAAKKADK
jgi:ribosomal protein S20